MGVAGVALGMAPTAGYVNTFVSAQITYEFGTVDFTAARFEIINSHPSGISNQTAYLTGNGVDTTQSVGNFVGGYAATDAEAAGDWYIESVDTPGALGDGTMQVDVYYTQTLLP